MTTEVGVHGGAQVILIRLLGGLVVEIDGTPIDLPATMQRRALIFLAVHANEVVGIDQLADAVWGDTCPKQLEHAVHSLVYRLRSHLAGAATPGSGGACIDHVHPGYSLVIAHRDIDVNRFTDDARRARTMLADDPVAARSLLVSALGLWRGEALLDVAYDKWASAEIRRLTETRLGACEALAEANIVLGEPELAVAELESLTERFPCRESLWALLWRAMAASGRYVDVAASHRRATEILTDQFQLSPSEHLTDVARSYAVLDGS